MLSQTGSKWKAHPALRLYSGMQFPQEPSVKEKDPFAGALVNSRWRGRESRPRSACADRCGACAPCELRWQTLARLLSSAPSRGSIPRGGHIKEKDPLAEVLVNSRWRGRESRPRAARTDRCGASRLASSAGKRSRVYSAPRPHGVRFHVGLHKEKDPFAGILVNSRWRGRESNP